MMVVVSLDLLQAVIWGGEAELLRSRLLLPWGEGARRSFPVGSVSLLCSHPSDFLKAAVSLAPLSKCLFPSVGMAEC